jgi:hypothetical protein
MAITYLDGAGATRNAVGSHAGTGGDPDISLESISTLTGTLTETAPATDTASSGLNGRMQRIAQRFTSLIALLPAALGQTTKTASLSVSIASDDDLQGKLGSLTETAPASDTASSGINGRLQRIAQRLTTLVTGIVVSSIAIPTSVFDGQTNVTTAGTRVVLAASQAILSGVTIKAKIGNTGSIFVGNSSVSSSNGYILAAGDTVFLEIANLNTVNLDATVSGEGVSYVAS